MPELIGDLEPIAEVTIKEARDMFYSIKNTGDYSKPLTAPTELVTTKDEVVKAYKDKVKVELSAVEVAQKAYLSKVAELDVYYETQIKPFRDALEAAIAKADGVLV